MQVKPFERGSIERYDPTRRNGITDFCRYYPPVRVLCGELLCFFPSKLEFRPNRVPVPARGIIAIGQFACGVITISQFGIGFTQELDA